jgi:23S rRNA (uracil1939-C5)-methyltransferase
VCPVLAPPLEAALPVLAAMLGRVHGSGEISLSLGAGASPVASIHVSRGSLDPRVFTLGDDLVARGFAGVVLWVPGATAPVRSGDPSPVATGGDGEPLVLAPDGFAQAHDALNPTLARAVLDRACAVGRRVLELYAGAGNFTVALARVAHSVVAVECDRDAVQCLRANLRTRSLTNVTVREEPAERCVDVRADVVLLDPPRTGAREVCRVLGEKALARTVVYVSCDPATLGRDLAALLPRYELRSLAAFEMFPHTGHVESVAALTRTPTRVR